MEFVHPEILHEIEQVVGGEEHVGIGAEIRVVVSPPGV
jgi:hypothetical protein